MATEFQQLQQRRLGVLGAWSVSMAVVLWVVHSMGVLATSDQWLTAQINGLLYQEDPAQLPVVIGLDENLVNQWGPPPWTSEQWSALAHALSRHGVEQAYVIGPTQLLIEGESIEGGAALHAPTVHLSADGETHTRFSVAPNIAPIVQDSNILRLSTDADGVLREQALQGSTESLWCDWVEGCVENAGQYIPIPPDIQLHHLSASDLFDDTVLFAMEGGNTALLGLTVPGISPLVTVGPRHVPASVVEATGWSIAAGRMLGVRTHLGAVATGGVLAGSMALSWLIFGLSSGRLRRAAWVWLPVLMAGVAALFYVLTPFSTPFSAAILCGAFPSVITVVQGRSRFFSFLRHADTRLMEIRQSAPFQTRPIHTHDQLLIKLGGLTRVYMFTDRCAWFVMDAKGTPTFFGGYGLRADDFQRAPRLPPRRIRQAVPSFMDEGLLVDENLRAELVPIYERDQFLGLWCIPQHQTQDSPDPQMLRSVLNWLEPRLVFQGAMRRKDLLDLRSGLMLDRLERLVREHRFQLNTVQNMDVPLMIADLSGEIQHTNTALQRLLERLELKPFATIRGLLFHLAPEEVQSLTARLYRLQEPVLLTWKPSAEHTIRLQLRPIRRTVGDNVEFLGFSVVFIERVRQAWNMSTHLSFLENMISETLSGSQAAQKELQKGLLTLYRPDDLRQRLMQVLGEYEGVQDALSRMRSFARLPEGELLPLADPSALIRHAVAETRALQMERSIMVQTVLPDVVRPVPLQVDEAVIALAQFLRYALKQTPESGWLEVRLVREDEEQFVEIQSSGGTLDAHSVARISNQQVQRLEPGLGSFVVIQELFGELTLGSDNPMGLQIRFPLPRSA